MHLLLGLTAMTVCGRVLFLLFALSTAASGRREVGGGEVEEDPRLSVSYSFSAFL